MVYCSVKEIAAQWGVSEQMVRRYCSEGRIKKAKRENGAWLIPEGAAKPKAVKKDKKLPKTGKKVVYQRSKNLHFDIYELIQVELAYSSNRMASNRLTREQVESIYRTGRISAGFEPTKVDDILEVVNHFDCFRYVVDSIQMPLSIQYIQSLHRYLTYGTFADRKKKCMSGEIRTGKSRLGIAPENIKRALDELVRWYNKQAGSMDLDIILEFHARFEKIHPFDDYNGRLGRILMMKECLRHGVAPFVIDDKHRAPYFKSLACWEEDPQPLRDLCQHAQKRFSSRLDTLRMLKRSGQNRL